MDTPRIVVAGLSGDSGKTVVSLSLLAALRRRGLRPSAFKKGPDYIDAAWLTQAAGIPCRNLDTYMTAPGDVRRRFVSGASGTDLALIEGNRGLFDGKDAEGTHSTAELARLLKAPVLLVVNATKVTRTVAALVKGCQSLARGFRIAGVVLNKTAGKRHRETAAAAVEKYCGVPVLGALPKLGEDASLLPGRHLGLVPPAESEQDGLDERLRRVAEEHLDVERILRVAREAGPVPGKPRTVRSRRQKVRIGCFRDAVFTFYYPENLEALEEQGAELVPVSSLAAPRLPEVDALYIGGGFPETFAERLAGNRSMMDSVRGAARGGMPVYAECGGLIYLSRSVTWKGKRHLMAGLFPVDLEMSVQPVGHGYTSLRADRENPYFEVGEEVRGHEFHYSGPASAPDEASSCMSVERGVGLGGGRDGLLQGNAFACYTHIHADGSKGWAGSLVAAAGKARLLAKTLQKE